MQRRRRMSRERAPSRLRSGRRIQPRAASCISRCSRARPTWQRHWKLVWKRPYSHTPAGRLSETRFTMQNSRLSLDVNSKFVGFDLHGHVGGGLSWLRSAQRLRDQQSFVRGKSRKRRPASSWSREGFQPFSKSLNHPVILVKNKPLVRRSRYVVEQYSG